MTSVRLDPTMMASAAVRLGTDVAPAIVQTSASIGSGMPAYIRPDLRIRVNRLQVQVVGSRAAPAAALSLELHARSGALSLADSGFGMASAFSAAHMSIGYMKSQLAWAQRTAATSRWFRHLIGPKPGRGGHPARFPGLSRALDARHRTGIEKAFYSPGAASKLKGFVTGLGRASNVLNVLEGSYVDAQLFRHTWNLFTGRDNGEAGIYVDDLAKGKHGSFVGQVIGLPGLTGGTAAVGLVTGDFQQFEDAQSSMREGNYGSLGKAYQAGNDSFSAGASLLIGGGSAVTAGVGGMLGFDTSGAEGTRDAAFDYAGEKAEQAVDGVVGAGVGTYKAVSGFFGGLVK